MNWSVEQDLAENLNLAAYQERRQQRYDRNHWSWLHQADVPYSAPLDKRKKAKIIPQTLSDEQIRSVRKDSRPSWYLGDIYHIAPSIISKIKAYKLWPHIQ